tara:strand:+ start:468 stop:830 length:363 start_codon:yes stop_codon:yes gene_type:complete
MGYMRYVDSDKPFYSKDKLWWDPTPISYTTKDSYTEFNDINQQWIFEGDILEMKPRDSGFKVIRVGVVFDSKAYEHIGIDCQSFNQVSMTEWPSYRLKVVSYLFINTGLLDEFSFRGYSL